MKLDEALNLLEEGPAATVKDLLKDMLSGDFKILQEAYYAGDRGTMDYPIRLKRLMDETPNHSKNSPGFKILQTELKAATAAKRAWQKTQLGKYL